MPAPHAEWLSTENTGLTESLRRTIDLIGQVLTRVIRQQASDDTFQRIVDLQNHCRRAVDADDPEALSDLAGRISRLDLDTIFWICRSYTVLFHLVNEAERQEITRINRRAERLETDAAPRRDSIRQALFLQKEEGLAADEAAATVDGLEILPTLTAHPTEVRRGSVLFKQNRIADLLTRISREETLGEQEKVRLVEEIGHEIALMMVTDDVRSDRLQAEDEIKNGLHYQTHAIWTAVPLIYRDLSRAMDTYFDRQIRLPAFLRYRSWIGGDRDGNPFITAELTRGALTAHRSAALESYRGALESLWRELSVSSLRSRIPEALGQDLAREAESVALDPAYRRRYRREPFRLKIAYMIAKIDRLLADPESNDYMPDQFRADLDLLAQSLADGGLTPLTSYRSLADLTVRSRVFGFHLAALDIRQHSRVHAAAVAELLERAGVTANYRSLSEDGKLAVLETELANPRPLIGRGTRLSESTAEMLEVMTLIGEAIERDPEAIGSYVVSMTHTVSDLLEPLLLAKEAAIWRTDGETVATPIDLVAAVRDHRGPGTRTEELMAELFDHPVLRAAIWPARGRICRRSCWAIRTATRTAATGWPIGPCTSGPKAPVAVVRGSVRYRISVSFTGGAAVSAAAAGGPTGPFSPCRGPAATDASVSPSRARSSPSATPGQPLPGGTWSRSSTP
jgi:phosphoenolpyruvate carboxylase